MFRFHWATWTAVECLQLPGGQDPSRRWQRNQMEVGFWSTTTPQQNSYTVKLQKGAISSLPSSPGTEAMLLMSALQKRREKGLVSPSHPPNCAGNKAMFLISKVQKEVKKELVPLIFSAAQAKSLGWGTQKKNKLGFWSPFHLLDLFKSRRQQIFQDGRSEEPDFKETSW